MPELSIEVIDVEPDARGLIPYLNFKLRFSSPDPIEGLILSAQIQLETPQRSYTDSEREKLRDLFGLPKDWKNTLRTRLWTHANTTTGSFDGEKVVTLPVQCSSDLASSSVKYLYALEAGEVPLLFLFSGSIFYRTPEGRLMTGRISWNAESKFRIPIETWKNLMEAHSPNTGCLFLHNDVIAKLYAHKRVYGLTTWDDVAEDLLQKAGQVTIPKTSVEAVI